MSIIVDRLLKDAPHQIQSELEMDRFVLALNGITIWGVLKQALLEIEGRRERVRHEEELLTAPLKWWRFLLPFLKPAQRGSEARLSRALHELAHYEKRAEEAWESLLARFGREADLTEDDIAILELELIELRHLRRALLEKATHGRVEVGTMECILALPVKSARDIARFVDAVPHPDCVQVAMRDDLRSQVDAALAELDAHQRQLESEEENGDVGALENV